ncbi:GAF domain-containing protein [Halalkalibaculum sp. DA3122]|uniref:GAF domain-containing protein n=1 Tax=unclassified Halalkalibaculum TaxID=2964617 RepID=UPI003754E3DD
MSTTTVENKEKIIKKTEEILNRPVSRDEKLFAICELLDDEVEVFDWVGFYLVDPEAERELVLGPYVGEATDHTRIPFGKGICGQAAESLETFVVQDVSEEDNYLACSIDVKAEIVVPILKDGELVGELDIDSHTKGSITGDHRKMLEDICEKIASEF